MKMRSMRNPMFDMSQMYEEFKKIDGLSLKTIMNVKVASMSMTTTTTTISVNKGDLPLLKFQVPAGYRQKPFKR